MEKANQLEAEGRSVIHFEIGQPDFVTPAYIRNAACASLEAGNTRYTSNYGTIELRRAIAEKLKKENQIEADPSCEIMVTVGGEEAMAAAVLALLDPGDEVLLTDPGYSPYDSMVKIACGTPVYVPLSSKDNFNFNIDELERRITDKTKLLILCNPSNPTGTVMGKEHLLELSRVCIEHDLLVLADEAYERLIYNGHEHISVAALPGMAERTITIQSFSKSYSMCGFRIGYLVCCKKLMQVIIRCHQKIVLCASRFAQDAALAALTEPSEEISKMLEAFNQRRRVIYDALQDLNIPCCEPQAAFYAFPDVSCLDMDGDRFAIEFLENYGVACVPGRDFGTGSANHVRISYATSLEDCEEGMRRLRLFVEDIRGRRKKGGKSHE